VGGRCCPKAPTERHCDATREVKPMGEYCHFISDHFLVLIMHVFIFNEFERGRGSRDYFL